VIWALAHKQKHVPYRDSKLTRLLQNSLGGNARTAILISASPHIHQAGETLSAMRFGARASKIQNNARINVAEDPAELKRLLQQARDDLAELRGHCRRLQAEVAAFQAVDALPAPRVPAGLGQEPSGGTLQALTAKKLYIWGFLPALVCPLKRAIMRDPVCAADGYSYERTAIQRHFAKAGRTLPLSPVSGERMPTRFLVPNLVVKQLIRDHLPDLAPPEVELPMFALLHVWLVQIILSFLDARSVGRCEAAWPSFLAAASSSQVWITLLRLDFSSEGQNENALDPATGPRARYATRALEAGPVHRRSRPSVAPASKGLQLRVGS